MKEIIIGLEPNFWYCPYRYLLSLMFCKCAILLEWANSILVVFDLASQILSLVWVTSN